MQEWPSTVSPPNIEYDHELNAGQSDPEDLIRPVRTRTYPERKASFVIDISQTEFAAFRTWFNDTLNGGCEWFTASWLETLGFTHHVAKFQDEGYSAQRRGIRWEVTLSIEIIATKGDDPYYADEDYDPVPTLVLHMPEITVSTGVS